MHNGLARTVGTDAQPQAEALIRKLEEELRLEKDVPLSTALLASRLTNKWERRVSWRPQSATLHSQEGADCHGLRPQSL